MILNDTDKAVVDRLLPWLNTTLLGCYSVTRTDHRRRSWTNVSVSPSVVFEGVMTVIVSVFSSGDFKNVGPPCYSESKYFAGFHSRLCEVSSSKTSGLRT